MTSITTTTGPVTGGVDTHGETHHAAVLDQVGRELGDREFPTNPSGYRALLGWLAGHGQLDRVGVEGTGAYGAALVLVVGLLVGLEVTQHCVKDVCVSSG
jgi:transposase